MLATVQNALVSWGISLSENAVIILLLLIAGALGFLLGQVSRSAKAQRLVQQLEIENQTQRQKDQDFFDNQIDQMQHQFSGLARKALSDNNAIFMNLANQQFTQLTHSASSELKLRHQGIENLLEPIKSSLQKTETQLGKIDALRLASETKLEEQIKQVIASHQELNAQTSNLVTALRRPEVRGQWGELTLKRLVEMAGMSQYCDFTEQPSVRSDETLLRPDMIIRLPSKRSIIVDVKTPLDAYLSAHESQDQKEREKNLKRHASNVRKRIVELSRKKYWEQFAESADFVLLFIPGDQFLNAALDNDSSLLEYAIENKVLLTTPTSLVGLLKTIAYGWQNDTLGRNTTEIRKTGDALLKRLNVLETHLGKLGRSLDQSVENYNRLQGSFNRNLKPAAQRLNELGIGQATEDDSGQSDIDTVFDTTIGTSIENTIDDQQEQSAQAQLRINCMNNVKIEWRDTDSSGLSLDGKIIVVTGAAQGIGRAVTRELAKSGATVIMVDHKSRHLEKLYDQIVSEIKPTAEPVIVPLDLETLTPEGATQFAQSVYDEFGKLDGLLHNAGELGSPSPLDQYDMRYWDKVMHINARAPYLLTRALLPVLRLAPQANIVFTTADCAIEPQAYWGAYAIAYSAVESQMKIWSEELLKTSNIAVNSLDPGAVRTSLRRRSHPGEDQSTLTLPQEITPVYLKLFANDHEWRGRHITVVQLPLEFLKHQKVTHQMHPVTNSVDQRPHKALF